MIILEFSLAQKCFHRTDMAEMIKTNFNNVISRKQTDYLPIACFETEEQLDEFTEKCSAAFKDYTMYKTCNGETVVISQTT